MLEQVLWLLLPEVVLLATGLLILGLDAFCPRPEDKRRLPYVALLGLSSALLVSLAQWGCTARLLNVLACDPFAWVIKVASIIAVGGVVLMSDAYVRRLGLHAGEFYALLMFSAMAMCLLGAATELIMIFLAIELISTNSYILTGYLRNDPSSAEAGLKYFLYGAVLSAVMLYGMSWLYGLTGSTDLGSIAMALRQMENTLRPAVQPALIFIIAGLAFKVALVPFHRWAPDAYEGAPTPVTAFLSTGPKIAGFAILVRVMLTALPVDLANPPLEWRLLLVVLAAITMTAGNLMALWQTNIKRLLAYSSIAHAGYILIGVAAASSLGTTAMLLYLVGYALTNLGAFAAIIAFSNHVGSDAIEDYAGLGKRMPLVAMGLLICLLSLGGIPPTAGFIGKLWLFLAAIEKGLLWLAIVGVINSVISLGYYWKIIRAMYMLPAPQEERLDVSPLLAIALGGAILGVFCIGLFPNPFLELFQAAARTFFAG